MYIKGKMGKVIQNTQEFGFSKPKLENMVITREFPSNYPVKCN